MDLIRVDYALIPDDPLFSAAIDASQAITDEYYDNANVVDAKKYPPHVSVHICGMPRTAISNLTSKLQALAVAGLPRLTATSVERSTGGWIMIEIERSDELMELHEAILELSAQANSHLDGDPYLTPYVRDRWSPHISIAKVDRSDQASAASIAEQVLRNGMAVTPRTLDLCDIGERSERWDVIASVSSICDRI